MDGWRERERVVQELSLYTILYTDIYSYTHIYAYILIYSYILIVWIQLSLPLHALLPP
jgi:hypothetical protein